MAASQYISQINGYNIYATASLSASYATTAQTLLGTITSASYAVTASYALNGGGGGGTPGGSSTQIQYNNGGAFGGVSALTFDGTTLRATGSFTGSFTGNLTGTASRAATASYSTTLGASLAQPANNQVQLRASDGTSLGTLTINNVVNATSASNASTASYIVQAISSSYALTASYSDTLGATLNNQGGSLSLRNSAGTSISAIANLTASLATAALSASLLKTSVANNSGDNYIPLMTASVPDGAPRPLNWTTGFMYNAGQERLTAINITATSLTGSLQGTATVASSVGTLNQNVLINGNLTVLGSASFQYITASQLAVSASYISVNVFEPQQRFGGLYVFDSGSSAATASLTWDSLNNRWVYSNASGSTYTGGMLLAGPRNTGSLGSETSLTRWFVSRGDGGDHLNDTQIFSSASIHQITGSLLVTDTVTASGSILVNTTNQTMGQFVGNTNGYVEFSVRNTSTGISASGDIAIYADNGTVLNNYIDIGINNSGLTGSYFYGGTDFGNALDAYVYNVGGNLRIGNATSQAPFSQSLFLFSNPTANPDITVTGSRVGILTTTPQFTLDVSGSIRATSGISGSFTGSLLGTASYITGSIYTSANPALSASYALTASYALNGGGGGVASITAGTGISVDQSTGNVTITNTGTSAAGTDYGIVYAASLGYFMP